MRELQSVLAQEEEAPGRLNFTLLTAVEDLHESLNGLLTWESKLVPRDIGPARDVLAMRLPQQQVVALQATDLCPYTKRVLEVGASADDVHRITYEYVVEAKRAARSSAPPPDAPAEALRHLDHLSTSFRQIRRP